MNKWDPARATCAAPDEWSAGGGAPRGGGPVAPRVTHSMDISSIYMGRGPNSNKHGCAVYIDYNYRYEAVTQHKQFLFDRQFVMAFCMCALIVCLLHCERDLVHRRQKTQNDAAAKAAGNASPPPVQSPFGSGEPTKDGLVKLSYGHILRLRSGKTAKSLGLGPAVVEALKGSSAYKHSKKWYPSANAALAEEYGGIMGGNTGRLSKDASGGSGVGSSGTGRAAKRKTTTVAARFVRGEYSLLPPQILATPQPLSQLQRACRHFNWRTVQDHVQSLMGSSLRDNSEKMGSSAENADEAQRKKARLSLGSVEHRPTSPPPVFSGRFDHLLYNGGSGRSSDGAAGAAEHEGQVTKPSMSKLERVLSERVLLGQCLESQDAVVEEETISLRLRATVLKLLQAGPASLGDVVTLIGTPSIKRAVAKQLELLVAAGILEHREQLYRRRRRRRRRLNSTVAETDGADTVADSGAPDAKGVRDASMPDYSTAGTPQDGDEVSVRRKRPRNTKKGRRRGRERAAAIVAAQKLASGSGDTLQAAPVVGAGSGGETSPRALELAGKSESRAGSPGNARGASVASAQDEDYEYEDVFVDGEEFSDFSMSSVDGDGEDEDSADDLDSDDDSFVEDDAGDHIEADGTGKVQGAPSAPSGTAESVASPEVWDNFNPVSKDMVAEAAARATRRPRVQIKVCRVACCLRVEVVRRGALVHSIAETEHSLCLCFMLFGVSQLQRTSLSRLPTTETVI